MSVRFCAIDGRMPEARLSWLGSLGTLGNTRAHRRLVSSSSPLRRCFASWKTAEDDAWIDCHARVPFCRCESRNAPTTSFARSLQAIAVVKAAGLTPLTAVIVHSSEL